MMFVDWIILGITAAIIISDIVIEKLGYPTYSQRIRKRATGKWWWFWRIFILANMFNLYMHWTHQDSWFW